MNDTEKIYIAGLGMITPVGGSAEMTAAAVRAEISGYQVSDYKNGSCKSITMATVPDDELPKICDDLNTSEQMSEQMGRMLMMAHIALDEVMGFYPGDDPLPMILCGPMADEDLAVPFSHQFFDLLMTQTGIRLDRPNCRLIGMGRAGVVAGIDIAMKYLDQGHDYILVGGVDSYREYELLLKLSRQDRILAEDVKDGFVPGEAACFLLLTGKVELAKQFNGVRLFLTTPGLAHEKGHFGSEAPYTGDGLAQAFDTALKNHGGQNVSCVYSSMNGEHFWAKEYGVAMLRNKQAMKEDVKHEHPIDCFGDLGAATGAVLISLAGLTLAREGKPHTSLIYCSSDTFQRGAICMSLSKIEIQPEQLSGEANHDRAGLVS